ncbi:MULTISPECIES: hypothetical protein [unclassified Nocardioides]|uniref:hypothetical protein n=1 Tax=unclassified Nocardioides TaxID=2615069 RepID=UPI0007027D2D|nr:MULTISPECIES: hypothetical protein [unclassified Nocardioides]KRC59677.1 hypothetical protein ASE19_01230 [Nocardioides sp. Root79]KRC68498.1 hypothetical protein ASE20_16730 [Nocardioides sp. Root240]
MTGPAYDAALHLLDRQVVDSEGRMVCKVDDLELTVGDGGELVPTGLLVGLPALLPRFGRRIGAELTRTHARIFEAQAHRTSPDVVDIDLVEEVDSEVRLSVPRAGLLRPRDDDPSGPERVRLGDLLGLPVTAAPGHGLHRGSRLLDVRLVAVPDGRRHVVDALVVGPGRPGALLGYDRRSEPGPWLVADLVRWLHRHARVVGVGPEVVIDREDRVVRVGPGASVRPLLG